MHAAAFTFARREFDDTFHALDQVIAQTASSITGCLSEESRENPGTGLVCNVYCWDSLDALRQLIDHPAQPQAKQRQRQWLDGDRVTIAQSLKSHGDGGMVHPLATTDGGACAGRVSPAVDR